MTQLKQSTQIKLAVHLQILGKIFLVFAEEKHKWHQLALFAGAAHHH